MRTILYAEECENVECGQDQQIGSGPCRYVVRLAYMLFPLGVNYNFSRNLGISTLISCSPAVFCIICP